MLAGSATRIRDELARARAADQVHGAYLFSGPPGTGKRETALWFARLLLCERDGAEPCESCRGCLRTEHAGERELNHPDLWLLEPDGNAVKIEQVRTLQRNLSLVANEGGRRVAILSSAERMRAEAANALLKTLEEPPENATLVLIATSANALPPTVRSRATGYRFASEPEAALEAGLRNHGLEPEDAWLAAALGGAAWPRPAPGPRSTSSRRASCATPWKQRPAARRRTCWTSPSRFGAEATSCALAANSSSPFTARLRVVRSRPPRRATTVPRSSAGSSAPSAEHTHAGSWRFAT